MANKWDPCSISIWANTGPDSCQSWQHWFDSGSIPILKAMFKLPRLIYNVHFMNHSMYELGQWEKALHSNTFSHWLSPNPNWSLHLKRTNSLPRCEMSMRMGHLINSCQTQEQIMCPESLLKATDIPSTITQENCNKWLWAWHGNR